MSLTETDCLFIDVYVILENTCYVWYVISSYLCHMFLGTSIRFDALAMSDVTPPRTTRSILVASSNLIWFSYVVGFALISDLAIFLGQKLPQSGFRYSRRQTED